jgi:hypothetical protein
MPESYPIPAATDAAIFPRHGGPGRATLVALYESHPSC